MAPRDHRSTRAWRKLRDQVVKEEPLCWLQLAGCSIYSETADHLMPAHWYPYLAMARSNLRGACIHCNNVRKDRPVEWVIAQRQPPAALDYFA